MTVTGKSSGGLSTFTATCAGAEDQAGNVAASVQLTYKVADGFSGWRRAAGSARGRLADVVTEPGEFPCTRKYSPSRAVPH
jgi:hypothetical protein